MFYNSRYRYVSKNQRTGFEVILFDDVLEVEYNSFKKHSNITCPFGYANMTHSYPDGTIIVFQWYKGNEQNQLVQRVGPEWDKHENNCFGRLIPK